MVKNAGSRVFHSVMAAICAVLCLVAIVSFSTFATIHNKIRNDWKAPPSEQCILFTKSHEDDRGRLWIQLSSGRSCVLAIWGEVFVAFLALLLGVVFIVKAVIGVNA